MAGHDTPVRAGEGSAPATRRAFLAAAAIGSANVAAALAERESTARAAQQQDDETPPTIPTVTEDDPAITARTIAQAEKLAAVRYTEAERELVLKTIDRQLGRFKARREVALDNHHAPATVFDPRLPGMTFDSLRERFVRSHEPPGPLPGGDEEIAFAPVTKLSRWIESRELSSERLTRLYLERLKTHGPKLECVVTLTEELALMQARRADDEIARGRYRGPLHGIPWGAKDLFDTRGIPTTWGAQPYRERVPERDAAVVKKLEEAGAVLVAKLTLGALAYGDVWFGGTTRNPWNLRQGSSGSSAGSSAATAAGLVGFALGTETYGSIVSPCMRCGATGLRPTFGRVPRTGAMALCWSLDKVGPITRTVEDAALVLSAIRGRDDGDANSIDMPLDFDAARPVRGRRIGYSPQWFQGERTNEVDLQALEAIKPLDVELVELDLPDWPYDSLAAIVGIEAAAAFEELTLTDRDDELTRQDENAWPNIFRQARLAPAVELVQLDRFRRRVMEMVAERFEKVEAILSPSFAASLLLITNMTGHPSLTLRAGFVNDHPHGVTLWGRLYEEGRLCELGMALERELRVWDRRPGME